MSIVKLAGFFDGVLEYTGVISIESVRHIDSVIVQICLSEIGFLGKVKPFTTEKNNRSLYAILVIKLHKYDSRVGLHWTVTTREVLLGNSWPV